MNKPIPLKNPDSNRHAIFVEQLSKRYGDFMAVNDISFTVDKGTIFGLLGANGAGKSTTIRMLCGLVTSTSGEAYVNGYNINSQPENIKKTIGYMSQKFSLYEDLTVRENIRFFGGVYGLTLKTLKDRIDWALTISGLTRQANTLTHHLSSGYKQRLALSCALLHNPPLVFLDEPTGAVDPISRRNFWDLINKMAAAGKTILVTTHYLDEAEYCNKITLMHAGRIIAEGSPSYLKKTYITDDIIEANTSDPVKAMEILKAQKWVKGTSIFGTTLHVRVQNDPTAEKKIGDVLKKNRITLQSAEPILASLEDVFITLCEKEEGRS